MADPRPQHRTVGPARTLYGDRGPVNGMPGPSERPMTTTIKLQGPAEPQNLEEHVRSALQKVPGMGPKTRQATVVAMMGLMRDIHFLRMLTDAAKARGPWCEAAVQDEGRPL